MAGSPEQAIATTSHSALQLALMSTATMVATVFLLLLCGLCRRLRKQGSHSMSARNGSLNRAPTTLTKVTHKNEDLPVNGTKTVEGIENGAFSASEPVEQSKAQVEMSRTNLPVDMQTSRRSPDSRRASQNKTLQGPQESLKHRRLPSIPHIVFNQPESEQNSGVPMRRPTVQPPEPPTYEEVHGGKAAVDAGPPVGGGLSQRVGPTHESWINDDEEWPAAPPLTLFDQPLENVYTNLKNESIATLENQPIIVPTVDSAGTQKSAPQATVGEEPHDKNSTSIPAQLSWRFHLALASDTEDSTAAEDPTLKGLYSKVKKDANRPVSLPSSTLGDPLKAEDDVPPPVPVKRFDIEEDLSTLNQDIEDPLPPPPILEIN
ncbi:uncharacterized protein LOC144761965 [Lissotriton helveticus]